jgi:hypothetical protein
MKYLFRNKHTAAADYRLWLNVFEPKHPKWQLWSSFVLSVVLLTWFILSLIFFPCSTWWQTILQIGFLVWGLYASCFWGRLVVGMYKAKEEDRIWNGR